MRKTEIARQQIACGEVMDIASMAEFHSRLMTVISLKQAVELDASQIERVDTAALQVLSSFVQDVHAQQQSMHWKNPSEVLCRSAALLGLSRLLNLGKTPGNHQQEAPVETGTNG